MNGKLIHIGNCYPPQQTKTQVMDIKVYFPVSRIWTYTNTPKSMWHSCLNFLEVVSLGRPVLRDTKIDFEGGKIDFVVKAICKILGQLELKRLLYRGVA